MTERPTLTDHIAEAERIRAVLLEASESITSVLRRRGTASPVERYMRGFDIAIEAIERAPDQLKGLADRMRKSVFTIADESPLQAVIAEIVAEGHEDVEVGLWHGSWRCRSRLTDEGMPESPARGGAREEWQRWEAKVEDGRVDAPSPLAAAQARLAEIRELHRQKIAEKGVAADVPPDEPPYIVRPTPKGFGVIYRRDGTLIAEFDSEDGAKGLMDELNRAAERGGEEGS